jgi:predicted dehydrogenase
LVLTGGGSLIRMGCHPLSAVLHLKQVEAAARRDHHGNRRHRRYRQSARGSSRKERPFIKASPVDVEDWGMLSLSFSDGSKSTIFSGDMILGGVRNLVETYTSGGVLLANITPNNHLVSYLTDETKLDSVYITEKVDRKTGWQFVCLEEE